MECAAQSQPIRTALIGGAFRDEFDEIVESVRSQSENRFFPDLKAFIDWTCAEPDLPVFELILILQSYSSQYSQTELNIILGKYPVTPFVCVLGSWCEGEQRTAIPLSGIWSIYVHNWSTEGEIEFKRLIAGEFSTFALSPVLSREEVFLESSQRRPLRQIAGRGKKAWIFRATKQIGSNSEMNRLLFEILKSEDFSVEYVDLEPTIDRTDRPDMIFWDLNETPLESVGEIIADLRKTNPETRLIVFKMSPGIEEKRFLCTAGADIVVSKPFELTSLLETCNMSTETGGSQVNR